MQDRPGAGELLGAVKEFLEETVVPALEGTHQFHARVAANVLAIVGRELVHGEELLLKEWRRLNALLETPPTTVPQGGAPLADAMRSLNELLAARIRAGDADAGLWRVRVLEHLHATAADRLTIANPKYAPPQERV